MNQRQLASVLFGVGGIFLVVTRLPEILIEVGVLAQWDPASSDPAGPINQRALATLVLGSMVLAAVLGVGLILFRDRLANRLFQAGGQPLSGREVQAVALSVLGCYFVVQGVARVYSPGRVVWPAVAQLALGIGLFVGARSLSRIWSATSPGADVSAGAV